MSRTELEETFCNLIVAARRADLSQRERDDLIWFIEREARLILEPLRDDGDDAWADIGGARRAAR